MSEDLPKENTEDSVDELCGCRDCIDKHISSGKANGILAKILEHVEANKNNPGDSWTHVKVYDDCKEAVLKLIEKLRDEITLQSNDGRLKFGFRQALRQLEHEVKKL